MGLLQQFQGLRDIRASSFCIVAHLVQTLAVIVVLHLTEGLHRLVQVVIDNGKTVTRVFKGLPTGEPHILGVIRQVHATLQHLCTCHRTKAVEIQTDNQKGIVRHQGCQLIVDILFHEVQLVKLRKVEVEVTILIII